MSSVELLHPALQYHIVNSLEWTALRTTQLEAIEPIQRGLHCLLLAPTAGGKTEAAVIPVLSRMLYEDWRGASVLYVCPIKALLNNLEERLSRYAGLVGRRVEVWHGDVSQSRKASALREAPDILLTTPESIEGMLISTRVDRAAWFRSMRTVIVDELHAFASDDRGWHLRSVLHRLAAYTLLPPQRIGLSATVSNPEELLAWFAPFGERKVIGTATVSTDADVTIDHVGSIENAATVIGRLHRGEKRLVFCDSRSVAERLSSLLRSNDVRTHVNHASLSASERRQAEKAFAEERDCVIVATSTLELGLDIGDLDRVIQIDAPSTVSSFLQRMGRTGRRPGGRRNCLFLTTRDEAFLLALGITEKWSEGWVEAATPPPEPWPLVAQQAIVATIEHGQLPPHELIAILSASFCELNKQSIDQLIEHLIARHYLFLNEGLVQVGPATEEEFARAHYRDLLASFASSPVLLGRHGSAELGYIDPTTIVDLRKDGRILLGGRSWRITFVEWRRMTAWLEPVAEGGRSYWPGSGARSIGPEVCGALRQALLHSSNSHITLSRRARARLRELQEEIPVSEEASATASMMDGGVRWWTLGGTVANRQLARELQQRGIRAHFDAFSISSEQGTALQSGVDNVFNDLILKDEERTRYAKALKFARLVPQQLIDNTLRSRLFGSQSQTAGVL